jgi:hypothetical protein
MDMKLRELAGTIFIILAFVMIMYLISFKDSLEGFVDKVRCGVDLPSCSGEHIRCINGYCKSDVPPKLPLISDLPMTPATKYPYA